MRLKIFSNKFRFLRCFTVIICNVLLISFLIVSADFLIYTKCKQEYIKIFKHHDIFPPISYIDNYKSDFSPQSLKFMKNNKDKIINYIRYEFNKDFKNKKSVLLFGCSYAYGYGLDNNQTFNHKLSILTKSNVFNFGICACGIQHMLFLLQNNDIYNLIKSEPEYAIYIYIPSHLKERLRTNIFPSPMMTNGINLQYRIKNNSLELKEFPFSNFSKTFIVKSLYYQFDLHRNNLNLENKYNNFILANEIFMESKKLLQEKYPNIKFVILKYEVENDIHEDAELPFMWDVLKQEGFIVIKSSDLIKRKYKYSSEDTIEDEHHPSEAAWDLLCPELIKKLNL